MKHHGYLVEYQLYDEFEMIRNSIKDSSLGAYWFWTGAANTATNKTYLLQYQHITCEITIFREYTTKCLFWYYILPFFRYVWLKNGNLLPDESPMWDPNHPDVLPNRHCVLHTYITSFLINYKCSGYAYPICEIYW